MKKLILFTFAFCLFTFALSVDRQAFSQEYGWKDISENIPTQADLSDVYFISHDEGWITSSSHAEIYHTTDGGETFEIQSTQYPTIAIKMLDSVNGYSGYSRIYMTTDGGKNWIAIDNTALLDLDFVTTSQGYACGDHGTAFSITPEGATNLNCQSNSTLRGITAPSENNVWTCGGSSIWFYNDSAFTGQSGPSGTYNDIQFINNQEGWVVGNGGLIGHTIDGSGWGTQTNPDTQNRSLYGVFFLDSDNGWAVGNGGIILHTMDGGDTWTIEGAGITTVFLRGVHFTSPTNGYVVGNNKTLLKYTQVSGVGETKAMQFDIYPNPASSVVSLQSAVFIHQSAVVEVYDLNGRKVLEKHIPAGSETIEIDVSYLNNGVYFCTLKTNKGNATKKLIIQK